MRGGLTAAATAALLSVAAPARADTYAYGLQLVAPDLIGDAAIGLGKMADSEQLLSIGFGIYLFAGPTIHAVHGNWGRAGISLGTRVALPVIGGYFGPKGDPDFLPIGLMAGILAAQLVDWLLIAREPGDPEPVMLTLDGQF